MESDAMARRGRKRNLEKERLYWDLLASGSGTVEACRQVGIGRRTGFRWRRENGGIRCRDETLPAPVAGRYLSLFERERVQTLTGQGVGVRGIAARLGRSPSTISRELARAVVRHSYDAGQAHRDAQQCARRPRRSKLAADEWLHDFVQGKLELEWSPEQISGYLRTHHREHMVSAETIYQGLYMPHRGALRRDLAKRLRTGRTLRQPRRHKNKRATRYIDPGRLIEDRPGEVEDRAVAGHWEGDLVRHEALCDRAEVKDLRRCVVAAA
jgi:IS30 family transposase